MPFFPKMEEGAIFYSILKSTNQWQDAFKQIKKEHYAITCEVMNIGMI